MNLERKLGNLTKERGMSRWVVISIRSLFLSLQILEVYDNEFRAALRGITRHKRGEIILGNRAIDY